MFALLLVPGSARRHRRCCRCAADHRPTAETVALTADSSKHMFERHAVVSRFCRWAVVDIAAAPIEHLF
jgi:hypothetical protein